MGRQFAVKNRSGRAASAISSPTRPNARDRNSDIEGQRVVVFHLESGRVLTAEGRQLDNRDTARESTRFAGGASPPSGLPDSEFAATPEHISNAVEEAV